MDLDGLIGYRWQYTLGHVFGFDAWIWCLFVDNTWRSDMCIGYHLDPASFVGEYLTLIRRTVLKAALTCYDLRSLLSIDLCLSMYEDAFIY